MDGGKLPVTCRPSLFCLRGQALDGIGQTFDQLLTLLSQHWIGHQLPVAAENVRLGFHIGGDRSKGFRSLARFREGLRDADRGILELFAITFQIRVHVASAIYAAGKPAVLKLVETHMHGAERGS
jgi:hypothetical protein